MKILLHYLKPHKWLVILVLTLAAINIGFSLIDPILLGRLINLAGDDASGLAVSEKLRTQIRGLRQAERNTEDGLSFIQTAEGFLGQSAEIIQRIRTLAIQTSNGIYTLKIGNSCR